MRKSHELRPGPWTLLGIWSVPALLSAFETVMFARFAGRPTTALRAFVGEAPQWYGWAVLTLPVLALGERWPIRRRPDLPNLFVHAAGVVAAGSLIALGDAAVNQWNGTSTSPFWTSARNWFVSGLPATTVAYFGIIAVGYALVSSARVHEQERRASALESQLRNAQLAALRMQLQPHFLFNSLNAIMALVRDRDTQSAVRALALLSDVLRATMAAGDAQETTLAEELDFVTRYLEIERVRFGDRLRVHIDVPDGLRDALVPTFVLQPFVENALKHGVLRDRGANEIGIAAALDDDLLRLRVHDDGRGLPAAAAPASGVGIANARARLRALYGESGGLEVRNGVGRGVSVDIRLPLRRPQPTPAPERELEAIS